MIDEERDKDSVCNPDTYQKIYTKNLTRLRNFIFYKCGSLESSQDIAQEAFLKLWENCAKIILGKEGSFLYVTANRIFLNVIRSESVHLKFRQKSGGVVNNESPEFQLIAEEFKAKLEISLSNIVERDREAFLMNRIDGLKYQEIADVLEVSIKTVEKRVGSCLRQLKESVDELKEYKI